MKKRYKTKIAVEVLGNLLLGAVLLTTTLVYAPALAQLSNYNPQGLKATTLEEVLVLPDEEIDLATAILILSEEWDASFDMKESLGAINRMAFEIRILINTEDDPERVISLINHYLFENKGYDYVDGSSRSASTLGKGKVLSHVIRNKKGNCVGLSLLYLALAERLELPFYGVVLPDHFFVRYDDGQKRINIETSDKGWRPEDTDYEKEYMLHPTYRKYNFYLRNLSKKEVIGIFLCNVGITYTDKGMYDEAIAELKKVAEINPNDELAYFSLGVAYGEKGMYDEEIAEYKKAIEINPNSSDAYTNLGKAYTDKEMYDEAIVELKKVAEMNSDDDLAHWNLGTAYHDKGVYDEAIAEYKKAIEINPDSSGAYNSLGAAYHDKGMYDEAIVEYKKAIEVNSDDDSAHFNLGLAYANKGTHDEAIAEFITAIEINPSSANAHLYLGTTYGIKGKYSLAIEHFDRAIELGSSVDPDILEFLEPYREK